MKQTVNLESIYNLLSRFKAVGLYDDIPKITALAATLNVLRSENKFIRDEILFKKVNEDLEMAIKNFKTSKAC